MADSMPTSLAADAASHADAWYAMQKFEGPQPPSPTSQDAAVAQHDTPVSSAGPPQVLRSSQLDALELDADLVSLLAAQCSGAFRFFPAGAALALDLLPEIEAALRTLLFKFTLARGAPTPGAALQNLVLASEPGPSPFDRLLGTTKPVSVFAGDLPAWSVDAGLLPPSRVQLRRLFLFSVVLRWAWARAGASIRRADWASSEASSSWRARAARLHDALSLLLRVVDVCSFLLLLRSGRGASPLFSLLGLRCCYADPRQPRALAFDLLHQQLLWQAGLDCARALAPAVAWAVRAGVAGARAVVAAVLGAGARTVTGGGKSTDGAGAGSAEDDKNESTTTAAAVTSTAASAPPVVSLLGGRAPAGSSSCSCCGLPRAVSPHCALPCGHTHCYACLRGGRVAAARAGAVAMVCGACEAPVAGMVPLTVLR